jgi:hypothetical protein
MGCIRLLLRFTEAPWPVVAHAGGFGLARDYSVTPDEARRVGLG